MFSLATAVGRSAAAAITVVTALVALAAAPATAGSRHAAMVIDANTGAVLHDSSGDATRHPASLTKMMTLYMAFELIDAGRLSPTTRIKISQEAAAAAPSKLDLDPGEEIAAIDAIKALVTKSANDMAIALAEHIGGSEANFVRLMNAKAKKIGMARTTFRNASGLPDAEQVTTARDMLTLALRLQDDFPRHYALFATRAFTYNGSTFRNHNTLLNSYRGTDGIKTGYTRTSGFNLVASVRRDGRHVVAAVFGGASAAARNAHMRVLLDRALAKASREVTRKPVLVARAAPAQRPARPVAAAAPAAATPATLVPPTHAPAVAPRAARPAPAAPQPIVPQPAAPAMDPQAVAAAPQPPDLPPPMVGTDAPAVEIAKVRRVMVAPRARPAAQPAAAAPANSTEESVGSAPPAPAYVPPPRPAVAVVPPAMVPAARAPAPIAQPHPNATPVLGARPSTLQAQAANLDGGRPAVASPAVAARSAAPLPPPYAVKGPLPPPQPSAGQLAAGGAFQIQVGAYATSAEAQRQLATIGQKAGGLLAAHQPLSVPVQKGDRQMFRARFAGFDANSAAKACLELRRLAVDCFVMKAE